MVRKRPVCTYAEALDSKDVDKVYSVISELYFWVPDSVEAWNVAGFREMVNLMEDYLDLDV